MRKSDDSNAAVDRRSLLKAGVAAAVAGSAAPAAGRGVDSAIRALRARVHGRVAAAGDPGYDEGRSAWNLAVDQRPLVTVLASREEDIVAAVTFARERGLGIAVQATGHGVALPADGGVLINTSRLRTVRIDPAARTAATAAGPSGATYCPRRMNTGWRRSRAVPVEWGSPATPPAAGRGGWAANMAMRRIAWWRLGS